MNFAIKSSNLSFLVFLIALIFTPLAFATVEIWSYTFAQVLIFLGLSFYFIALVANKDHQWMKTPGLIWLLLLCLYILFQAVKLPEDVIAILSPNAWQIYKKTIWSVSPDKWMPLSVNRKATIVEFFRISSSVGLYCLTIQILSNKKRISRTLLIVCSTIAIISFIAIIQKFTSPGLVYWIRKMGGDNPVGPWVNRNHYAGFMAMALPLILALFLNYKPKIRYKTSWRKRLHLILALPESNVHLLLALASILVAVSIFLSLSRGGIICMSLGLAVFIFFTAQKKYSSKNIVLLSLIVLTIIVGVSWFGWQPIIERFENTIDAEGQIIDIRPVIWKDTSNIIKAFPVTGAGLGSFIDIYRAYRTVSGRSVISHAHNDYLELMTDGGAIASILALFFFISLFRFGFKSIRKRRDRYFILLFYGTFSGVLSLLLHSLVDFNLHIGANCYYFFFYCGLMVSAAATRGNANLGNPYTISYGRIPAGLGLAFSILLLMTTIYFQSGRLNGENHFSEIRNVFLFQGMDQNSLKNIEQTARTAISDDPIDAQYWYALANIASLAQDEKTALAYTIRAVEYSPLSCNSLQKLARSITPVDTELAARIFSESIELNQQKADCIDDYAEWLFSRKNRSLALKTLHDALLIDPTAVDYYLPTIKRNNVTVEETPLVLPPDPDIYIKYAQILWQSEQRQKALTIYEKRMEYLYITTEIKPSLFLKGYSWYKNNKQDLKAFEVLTKGVKMLPDNARLRELLGDHYQKQKIFFRAIEEYNKALALEPGNLRIKNKLDNISKQIRNVN